MATAYDTKNFVWYHLRTYTGVVDYKWNLYEAIVEEFIAFPEYDTTKNTKEDGYASVVFT